MYLKIEKWQERDYRRNQITENAVEAADKIILDGSDGSAEETNYLTAGVARKFMEKALLPLQQELFRKDISKKEV